MGVVTFFAAAAGQREWATLTQHFIRSGSRLGALSLLESAAQTDGATISSLSIPFFVIAIGASQRCGHSSAPPSDLLAREEDAEATLTAPRRASQPPSSPFRTTTS